MPTTITTRSLLPFDVGNTIRGFAAAANDPESGGIGHFFKNAANPAPAEERATDAIYRTRYAPFLQTIDTLLNEGDATSALASASGLARKMDKDGVSREDVERFAGRQVQLAAQAAFANPQGGLQSTQGQNVAFNAAGMQNPMAGPKLAEAAAGMPARRLEGPAAEANIAGTQARTENTRTMTSLGIPAQAAAHEGMANLYNAEAGAYSRGEMARGRTGGNTMANVLSGARIIQKYDNDITKALKTANNPNEATALIDNRNFLARSLGQPEVEPIAIFDPNADPNLPLAQRETFALRVKKEQMAPPPSQAQPAQGKQTLTFGPGPQAPSHALAPNAAEAAPPPAAPMRRIDFQAAVQNPLGVLPANLQQALTDPSAALPPTDISAVYQSMGLSPANANYVADLLVDQLGKMGQGQAFAYPGTPPTAPPAATPQPTRTYAPTPRY